MADMKYNRKQALDLSAGRTVGVGFKFGTQAAADKIITDGKGAVEGSFYLTDAHRLYIGAAAGTMTGDAKDYTLYSVNEGVMTVNTISDLPVYTKGTDEAVATSGRFFYVKDKNMLCVWNGQDYILINYSADTAPWGQLFDGEISEDKTTATVTSYIGYGDRVAEITTPGDDFILKGVNGITFAWRKWKDGTDAKGNDIYKQELSIIDDTDSLGTEAGTRTLDGAGKVITTAKITLSSDKDATKKSEITLQGKDATLVTETEDGVIQIESKNTVAQSIDIGPDKIAGEGIEVIVTNNDLSTVETTFNPHIKYGKLKENGDYSSSTTFAPGKDKNGNDVPTAYINVYSREDIDNMLKSLNGMTYRGTYDELGNGTFIQEIVTDTVNKNVYVKDKNGNRVEDVHIGDMFIAGSNGGSFIDPDTGAKKKYPAGTIFICRGTEDTDGNITAATLRFDIIEATIDVNTLYALQRPKDQANYPHSLVLKSNATDDDDAAVGQITFEVKIPEVTTITNGVSNTRNAQGANIHIDSTYESLDDQGNLHSSGMTVKLSHDVVTRQDDAATDVNQKNYNTNASSPDNHGNQITHLTINPVTGVTTDDTGHITGVTTTPIHIYDTTSKLEEVATETSSYDVTNNTTKEKTYMGVVKNTVSLNDFGGNEMSQSDYLVLSSSSLQIVKDDTHGVDAAHATTAVENGLSIEMVWGTF